MVRCLSPHGLSHPADVGTEAFPHHRRMNTRVMTRWQRRLSLAVAVVAIQLSPLTSVGPSASASSPALSITRATDTVRWSGEFAAAAGIGAPLPASCAATDCDEIFVDLDLRERAWNPDGGLQVGVRWTDEEQDLDLFVYGPDGELAARSDGIYASTSESVLIAAPHDGRYRIVVAPREVEDQDYEGVAQIERGNAAAPVRDLRPDLIALPPRHATFNIGAYLHSTPAATPASCYPEEIVEDDARRCLRFDQILGNEGAGPFELRYDITGIGTDQQLAQRIYRSDGSSYERPAGTYEFHKTHAHFHYRNFAVSELWASDESGRRLGDVPIRVGKKNGFCVIDIENIWFGQRGDAARAYYFPQCDAPTEVDPSSPMLRQGMSVGWADVYNWFLADQYIEVTGVPDGYYVLTTIADADQLVLETNENNNEVSALIRICGDAAEVVGEEPTCP